MIGTASKIRSPVRTGTSIGNSFNSSSRWSFDFAPTFNFNFLNKTIIYTDGVPQVHSGIFSSLIVTAGAIAVLLYGIHYIAVLNIGNMIEGTKKLDPHLEPFNLAKDGSIFGGLRELWRFASF